VTQMGYLTRLDHLKFLKAVFLNFLNAVARHLIAVAVVGFEVYGAPLHK